MLLVKSIIYSLNKFSDISIFPLVTTNWPKILPKIHSLKHGGRFPLFPYSSALSRHFYLLLPEILSLTGVGVKKNYRLKRLKTFHHLRTHRKILSEKRRG